MGAACGIFYAIGGFFVDLFTTGLKVGTALAMLALVVMPVIGWTAGFIIGWLRTSFA